MPDEASGWIACAAVMAVDLGLLYGLLWGVWHIVR